MRHRALVVEDDEDVAEVVADQLTSLGHDHDRVTCQQDARAKMAVGGYSYMLLDLQIPLRPGGGFSSVEFGAQVAYEARQTASMVGVPIIVMTAYGKEGLERAGKLCASGVAEFINKPFPEMGRTLASVINMVLDRRRGQQAETENKPVPSATTPFTGGEMVFHADRIELCGVTVVCSAKSSQMYAILGQLAVRQNEHRYKALSGNDLAKAVGTDGGQGSIAGSVRDFRRHVVEILAAELGIKVNPEDVIETARGGYRLNHRVAVRRHNTAGAASESRDTGDAAGLRRERILSELAKGRQLRGPELATTIGCSYSTVKRELEILKAKGRITFIGAAKTGHYTLAEKVGG